MRRQNLFCAFTLSVAFLFSTADARVFIRQRVIDSTYGYIITDLGGDRKADGINSSGQVAGASKSGSENAFIWQNGLVTHLGTLGGSGSSAFGINKRGDVVGDSYIAGNNFSHAFYYRNGTMIDIGQLGGIGSSTALSINDSDRVVGFFQDSSRYAHAFLYSSGTMTDLGLGLAYSINGAGQVVGQMPAGGHAFLYSNGNTTDLGTLGGDRSEALAINDSGEIVGYAELKSGYQHAFIYSRGAMKDIDTQGSAQSIARAINHTGDIVGDGLGATGSPFLYRNGTMVDLNHFLPVGSGWILKQANGINDAGQIVGWGFLNGIQHAFLLSPVTTGIDLYHQVVQSEFYLFQNFPNPFNPSTIISFAIPARAYVSLKVFDVTGREASTLVSEELSGGSYSRTWNSAGLPSGVYFYRLVAGSFTEIKKLVLLR